MRTLLVIITPLLAAVFVGCQTQGALKVKGADAFLIDTPRCQFAWIGWAYTTTTNPVLLTRNTLDRSMIGIMRVPVGRTLPRGKTRIADGMSTEQIMSLLFENAQGRGEEMESVTSGVTTIAGAEAGWLRYAQRARSRQGKEYGFIRGGYFFHLLFLAVEDPEYQNEQKDFERITSTFRVLQ